MASRNLRQNPVKAGVCKEAEGYEYSGMRRYLGKAEGPAGIDVILAEFSIDPKKQARLFEGLSKEERAEESADIDGKACFSTEALDDRRAEICGARSAGESQRLSEKAQGQAVKHMRAEGVSIRQIVRITGMPFGLARKAER